ncbi:c-type cytochrome [Frateuria aurantia]
MGALCLLGLGLGASALAQTPSGDLDEVARGKYLVTAADCVACHTAPGGQLMAGGVKIPTPAGTLVTPNITPDPEHGLGQWSAEEFYRALHEGIGRHGEYLYPAFPFDAYTHLSRDEVTAIWAYLRTVPPVASTPPPSELRFPFNQRALLWGWRLLNFRHADERPRPPLDTPAARGQHLAEALAHCGTCHTPRNWSLGMDAGRPMQGGSLGGWYAPDLRPGRRVGLDDAPDAELASYLRTGQGGHAVAAGPMAEVVQQSLSQLPATDIDDLVAWLRNLPRADGPNPTPATASSGAVATAALLGVLRHGYHGEVLPDDGAHIYAGLCSSCHGLDGSGGPDRAYPDLLQAASVQAARADNLVMTVLQGVHRAAPAAPADMPGYAGQLDDAQIAAVSNWISGRAGIQRQLTAADVRILRAGQPKRPVLLQQVVTGCVAAVLLLLVLWLAWRRRRR